MKHSWPCLLLVAAFLGACSDNEAPPSEDHTPTTYSLLINDVPVTQPYTFIAGQSVRVRIKFFNADGVDLDEVADSHFGGLTFEPATLATVARDSEHNYQLEVTGGEPGSGTLRVSYGHDDTADEHFLPVASVNVTQQGGENPDQ
jgi:hypothetical protein